jgi:hypothetical protein
MRQELRDPEQNRERCDQPDEADVRAARGQRGGQR